MIRQWVSSESVAQNIDQIILSLQFQDITRQEIEAAVVPIKQISSLAEEMVAKLATVSNEAPRQKFVTKAAVGSGLVPNTQAHSVAANDSEDEVTPAIPADTGPKASKGDQIFFEDAPSESAPKPEAKKEESNNPSFHFDTATAKSAKSGSVLEFDSSPEQPAKKEDDQKKDSKAARGDVLFF